MEPLFRTIRPKDTEGNIFSMLDDNWMLVTAGIPEDYNMMTASWGGFGILWKKPVAYVFIRPQRYTYLFTEKHDLISLSFFTDQYRPALDFCGSKSGRDHNKTLATGLTPLTLPGGGIAFQEASLIMETKKIYAGDILPECFVDQGIQKMYPLNDYHRMYICDILSVYQHK